MQRLQDHHRRIRDAPLEVFAIRLPVLEGIFWYFLLLLFFLLLAFLLVRLVIGILIGQLQETTLVRHERPDDGHVAQHLTRRPEEMS